MMLKKTSKGWEGWIIFLLALILPMACTAKSGTETGASEDKRAGKPIEAGSAEVGFGDAVIVPAIGMQDWNYLIAYKPDGTGYFEAYGDDTYILRAGGINIGVLEQSERLLGGERMLAKYSSSRVLEERIFSRIKQGVHEPRFLVLKSADGGIRVEGEAGQSLYSRTSEGGLRIERSGPKGGFLEEYLPDGSSRLSREGELFAEGGMREQDRSLEYFERRVEDKDGVLELFYTLQGLGADRYRSEVGSVEPIASVLIEGLSSISQGDRPLENLAVLDQIMGSERRITPLLALAYLGKLPSGGK